MNALSLEIQKLTTHEIFKGYNIKNSPFIGNMYMILAIYVQMVDGFE